MFWSGYHAVIVFFVMSGFLIAGRSLRRWSSLGRIRLRAFYTMLLGWIVARVHSVPANDALRTRLLARALRLDSPIAATRGLSAGP